MRPLEPKKEMKALTHVILTLFLPLSALGQWDLMHYDESCIFRSVFFINDSVGFVTTNCDQQSQIWRTMDQGESWTVVSSEQGNFYYDVYFPSDSIGYVSAYTNVLKTVDGGSSWFYPNPEFEGYPYKSIAFENDEFGLGCFADAGGTVAVTNDGGYTWIEDFNLAGREIKRTGDCSFKMISGFLSITDECQNEWVEVEMPVDDRTDLSLAFDGETDVVFTCGIGFDADEFDNFGFVGSSSNNGNTWEYVDFNSIHSLKSIVSPESGIIYGVGLSYFPNPMSFIKSSDDGQNWGYQEFELYCDDCFSPDVRDVFCVSADMCFAVTASGAIYRTLNGGGDSIPLEVRANEFASLQIYPNPFCEFITINGPRTQYNVVIFDTAGQLIHNSKNGPGEARIDLSELVGGCYIVRVESETGVSYKSVIKL